MHSYEYSKLNNDEFFKTLCNSKVPVEGYTGKEAFRGFFKGTCEEMLEIQFFGKSLGVSLEESKFLQIQFVFVNKRYQFISDHIRCFGNGIGIEMKAPRLVEVVDVRHYPRLMIDYPFRVYFSLHGKTHLGFIKNISEGGFLFTSGQNLEKGIVHPFALSLSTDEGTEDVCFGARVVHLNEMSDKDRYKIGVEFNHLEDGVHNSFRKFILKLRSKKISIPEKVSSEAVLKKLSNYVLLVDKNVSKNRILCIENKRSGRNVLNKTLSTHYDVDFLTEFDNIFSKIASFKPHLILSEINLGNKDFFMLYNTVREKKKNIPFVVYTTNNNKMVIANALKRELVCEYIVKPIIPKELISRLDQVMNSVSNTKNPVQKPKGKE